MPRAHLFSLRIGHALREVWAEGYSRKDLTKDLLAGLVVGIIAIPLAMALAIASGVPPQYGLYTVIFAGLIVALTGGSRYSISGPTAAFVVILNPIAMQQGLAGLLIATVMAGGILVVMAYARLGRFIEYIPESVTLGFTGGIAIVMATLQVPDLLGTTVDLSGEYLHKWLAISHSLDQLNRASLSVAVFTLAFMILWPRFNKSIPAHLPSLLFASLLGFWLNSRGAGIDTIGTRFQFVNPDGSLGMGIPAQLPSFDWPWNRMGPDGGTFELSFTSLGALLPSAFAIAMLGAIESLLCAVVLDGMSGKRHSANSELLGQGIGNILTPFFGGITATAALARSSANYKAGAISPIAAVVHALVVLAALLLLSRVLSYLPMPALAAMLLIVAWNMSEAPKALRMTRKAPLGDVAVFVVCLCLTVFVDMVMAITVGILLASLLFMREIAGMTKIVDVTANPRFVSQSVPDNWKVFEIKGPLFFAAADRVFSELAELLKGLDGVVLYMDSSPLLDAGGVSAMERLIKIQTRSNKCILFAEWPFQPLKTLAKSGFQPIVDQVEFFPSLDAALQAAERLAEKASLPNTH